MKDECTMHLKCWRNRLQEVQGWTDTSALTLACSLLDICLLTDVFVGSLMSNHHFFVYTEDFSSRGGKGFLPYVPASFLNYA